MIAKFQQVITLKRSQYSITDRRSISSPMTGSWRRWVDLAAVGGFIVGVAVAVISSEVTWAVVDRLVWAPVVAGVG